MRLTKFLAVVFVAVLLPVSLTFGQTGATAQKPAATVDNPDQSQDKKPVIAKSKNSEPEPEIPLSDARIAFKYSKFDFGTVPNGAQMTHYFPVTNIGPDTLYITKIKAG